jgi:hypothetical protein
MNPRIDGWLCLQAAQRKAEKAGKRRGCQTNPSVVDSPADLGETHWTVTKLCGWLREEIRHALSNRMLLHNLHENDYARRVPRHMPEPPDGDDWEMKREAFLEEFVVMLEKPRREVFFKDEADFKEIPDPV